MDEQLQKWLNGELSDGDLAKSTSPSDALKYRQIVNEVDNWVPDNDKRIFDPKEVTSKPKEAKTRTISRWIPLSIAASMALAIISIVWIFNSSDTVIHKTGYAEIKEVLLPDGSKVTLAPSSTISWKKEDWEAFNKSAVAKKKKRKTRTVSLEGKGLFEVEKGDPFDVITDIGNVEVLGTTFEVDEFEEGMSVICFEGKVRATVNQLAQIVNGGSGFLFYAGQWEAKATINESGPSWLQNETKFDNAPLTQVIKNLENLFEVEIVVGDVNTKRRYTGSIPNDKLDVALKLVFDPLGISYERKGSKLYLKD